MPTYRLHYFPESGNSYKLALMLKLCGQTFEPVWTDFGGGVTRTPEWRRAVNAMGEIPVLEIDGVAHTQTAPILIRLAQQYNAFSGRDDAERDDILRWLFWDNHKLTGYMATYRYYRAFTAAQIRPCSLSSSAGSTTSSAFSTAMSRSNRSSSATVRPSPTSRCAPTCRIRKKKPVSTSPGAISRSTRGSVVLRRSQVGARRTTCCRDSGCSGLCDVG